MKEEELISTISNAETVYSSTDAEIESSENLGIRFYVKTATEIVKFMQTQGWKT